MSADSSFLGRAKLELDDPDVVRLLSGVLSRIPPQVPPLRSVASVSLKPRGSMRGLVGLTWCGVRLGKPATGVKQTIAFYKALLYRLSDDAKAAVMAHELAHAWLNEYDHPEQSKRREEEADTLARDWGFGQELSELDKETEPV